MRIVSHQMIAHVMYACQHAPLKISRAESHFHFLAYFFPRLLPELGMHAPVGNDFHLAICQYLLYQHAVVVLRVPYAQF